MAERAWWGLWEERAGRVQEDKVTENPGVGRSGGSGGVAGGAPGVCSLSPAGRCLPVMPPPLLREQAGHSCRCFSDSKRHSKIRNMFGRCAAIWFVSLFYEEHAVKSNLFLNIKFYKIEGH